MKRIRFFIVILAAALLLAGCGDQNGTVTVIPSEAAAVILEELSFTDELLPSGETTIDGYYPGLREVAGDWAVYISGSGYTCEEIAVVRAAEGATAQDVTAVLEQRLAEQRFRYENYQPQEMVKLNDPVLEAEGDTVILILSDDSGAAGTLARDILAGKK